MTDEKNITPQPSGDGREVISWYVPPERGNEVVRCYVQPQPLPQGVRPQPPQMAPQRGKKRGWIIFVILAAVLAAIVGVTALVVSLTDDGDSSTPDDGNAGSIVDISGNEECYIPKAPTADGQQMELLAPADTELTPAEVYQKMSASTVTVLATDDRGNTSMGTGVLLTADGYIVTNAHVVSEASSSVVALDTGRTYEAELVGYAPGRDIAVLKAVDAECLTPAEFCDSDYCMVGETVYVIGNPLNLNLRGTFTNGILSGLEREMELDGKTLTMLQTNAAVNNGNSGGPLINAYGQVIGINTLKMSNTLSDISATVEGLGFAVPSSRVVSVITDIIATGGFHGLPSIGVYVQEPEFADGTTHPVIDSVTENFGAEEAGLQKGDVILAADGIGVSTNTDLLAVRRTHIVGENVVLTIRRDGQTFDVTVVLYPVEG